MVQPGVDDLAVSGTGGGAGGGSGFEQQHVMACAGAGEGAGDSEADDAGADDGGGYLVLRVSSGGEANCPALMRIFINNRIVDSGGTK